MARRRARERTVFLPWERQGALLRRHGLTRVRPFVIGSLVLILFAWLGVRERQRSGVRATRATLLVARRAVDTYRADHKGDCPPGGLDEVVSKGYLPALPRDAWSNPLRLTCPARAPGKLYELSSDGPDGLPGGLDRVE